MTTWLIDKSALVRLGASPDGRLWAQRIERGLVRITAVTRLEVGRVKALTREVDPGAFVVTHLLADVTGGVVRRAAHH